MSDPSGSYVTVMRQLVEEDIAKQIGRPIHNKYIIILAVTITVLLFTNFFRYLWTCLVLDFLLVQIVIGPFTVAIWRGAWELYDDLFLVKKFLSSFWSKLWTDETRTYKKNVFVQNLLGEDRMIVGFVCFICGFVVGFKTCGVLKMFTLFFVQVSVLVAVFYRDIDFVAKKAGRKQYFIVTRWAFECKCFLGNVLRSFLLLESSPSPVS